MRPWEKNKREGKREQRGKERGERGALLAFYQSQALAVQGLKQQNLPPPDPSQVLGTPFTLSLPLRPVLSPQAAVDS